MNATVEDLVELVADSRAERSVPLISVVVATHERPALLTSLVRALEAQTMSSIDFEVIIVDDGSSGETSTVLRRLVAESPLQILAVRQSSGRGPASARNIGWRYSESGLLAFTDDDCAPTPTWLEAGYRAIEAGLATVIVGRTEPDPTLPRGPFSRTMVVRDIDWLPACNVFYRRADVESVGGFDERFPTPGGEDTDLAFRVRDERSGTFAFEERALIYHDVRESNFREACREALRWVGIPLFFRIHPSARNRLVARIFWKESHPLALVAALGVLLSPRRPACAAFVIPWLQYRRRSGRPHGRRREAIPALPGILVVDLLEVFTMVRGSLRSRTLVL